MNHLFANASSDKANAQYMIIGIPYDATTSFRPGTRFGPLAIREMSYNFESYLPFQDVDLRDVPFYDASDIEPSCLPDSVIHEVEIVVTEVIGKNKIPIILGGEHSITIGAVRAIKPEWYIVCDAHLDLRDQYRDSPNNHACTTRRVFDSGVENIIILGARSGTPNEYEFAKRLCVYYANDVHERGIADILKAISKKVFEKRIYLSIDADVIDCCLTPGLGTPEPFGLTPADIREVIRKLAPQTVGFDYVEVCPIDSGQTATVASQMVREFIASHWKEKKKSGTTTNSMKY